MEYNEESNFTDQLPIVRCTPEMRAAMQQIARRSMTRNLSDHIRYAVELYINMENAQPAESRERVPA